MSIQPGAGTGLALDRRSVVAYSAYSIRSPRYLCRNPVDMQPEIMEVLIERLDSFDASERHGALAALADTQEGRCVPKTPREVNMHSHTFFSYNGLGYSPSRFAWEACRYGLEVAGIVDFDVLDGVEEFLTAGRLLGLKTTAGFETRVFVRDYGDKVINSPNEPGVAYLVGTGFVSPPRPGTLAARTLGMMRECARSRNLKMLRRINDHLAPVRVDYEEGVVTLTPAGNVTERHMLEAYEKQARSVFPEREELVAFWYDKLDMPTDEVRELVSDPVKLKNVIRSRLMKFGGVGYAPPEEGSFPVLEDVVQMTLDCGALPSACWLDGTSEGESDPMELLGYYRETGCVALTIIPDRNWNVADAAERAVKVRNFEAVLDAADQLQMPVLVGTEMNKYGLKFVDTFSAPEMAPHRQTFLEGARFAWGHTLLMMTAGVGATGEWATRHFGDDIAARNDCFRKAGAAPYPDEAQLRMLFDMDSNCAPDELLEVIQEQ